MSCLVFTGSGPTFPSFCAAEDSRWFHFPCMSAIKMAEALLATPASLRSLSLAVLWCFGALVPPLVLLASQVLLTSQALLTSPHLWASQALFLLQLVGSTGSDGMANFRTLRSLLPTPATHIVLALQALLASQALLYLCRQ